jgi:hypothetical protein
VIYSIQFILFQNKVCKHVVLSKVEYFKSSVFEHEFG